MVTENHIFFLLFWICPWVSQHRLESGAWSNFSKWGHSSLHVKLWIYGQKWPKQHSQEVLEESLEIESQVVFWSYVPSVARRVPQKWWRGERERERERERLPTYIVHVYYIIAGHNMYLSSEQMEVLCWSGGVGHLHVQTVTIWTTLWTVTLLKEPLDMAGGVVRPRPIVAVGKQHHQTTLQQPLHWKRKNIHQIYEG